MPAAAPTRRLDRSLPAQGYELRITESGVELGGGDDAGLFYGEATLRAARAASTTARSPSASSGTIPISSVRGVMLDISRDKVPTMATLQAVIDRLASLKINQVQLYSEHTFAYRDHPDVHAAASPLDAGEIRQLDAFCRARHVELVPNQNCLGHMNRWLGHDALPAARHRAGRLRRPVRHHAAADDHRAGQSRRRSRSSASCWPSCCRSSPAGASTSGSTRRGSCRRRAWTTSWPGSRTLRALPELEGREMLMWGDMVSGRPDLVGLLPAGVTVCEWGYDDWYPFDERCAVLAERACPSGWHRGPRAG